MYLAQCRYNGLAREIPVRWEWPNRSLVFARVSRLPAAEQFFELFELVMHLNNKLCNQLLLNSVSSMLRRSFVVVLVGAQ